MTIVLDETPVQGPGLAGITFTREKTKGHPKKGSQPSEGFKDSKNLSGQVRGPKPFRGVLMEFWRGVHSL